MYIEMYTHSGRPNCLSVSSMSIRLFSSMNIRNLNKIIKTCMFLQNLSPFQPFITEVGSLHTSTYLH